MSPTRLHEPRSAPLAALICALLAAPLPALAAPPASQPPDAPTPAGTDADAPAPPAAPRSGRPFTFDSVVVRGGLQPTSLPTRIPTTMEGITHTEIADRVNATDAEDALKYMPSLLVRKRYPGDYDHAVLATRASGTGNSARSLVYADGVLISNLLGNGANFAPRWGLVNPEEIERVDVLYGPFSAAYSGNSVGAVVDYVTRMPEGFEAHAKLGYSVERFRLYDTDDTFATVSWSASIGDRWDRVAAWLSVSRLDSDAHPITFTTLPMASGGAGTGTPVDGAITGRNPKGQPWYVVGTGGQTDTVQDQLKLKLGYDLREDLRLNYVFGLWRNEATRDAASYLTDASGQPAYSGDLLIDGRRYTLAPTAFPLQRAELVHRLHGASLKRHGGGAWDYTIGISRYEYAVDRVRSPLVAPPAARTGGAGRIADSAGTHWETFSASATWRPVKAHVAEFGLQDDRYNLDTEVSGTSDWIRGGAGARVSAFGGTTELRSLFAQDTWTLDDAWTGMLGARLERWDARDGRLANDATTLGFAERSETTVSPKAALQFRGDGGWTLKASIGRAVRFPTVSELYQGSIASNAIVNNDPDLKPERSVTSELSWVRQAAPGRVRVTLFHERTRDALYSQVNAAAGSTVTTVQNVDAIRTRGLEMATELSGVFAEDFDLDASVTFTDSIITANRNFPASVGHWQPRVPRWRANLVGVYHPGERWSFTGAVRYSGRQFNTLDNSDPYSDAYTGTSPFLVADARVRYRRDAHWTAAVGIDNLTDRTYWNFHPYNQRTWTMELRYDH